MLIIQRLRYFLKHLVIRFTSTTEHPRPVGIWTRYDDGSIDYVKDIS